jgi:hypothetical protein
MSEEFILIYYRPSAKISDILLHVATHINSLATLAHDEIDNSFLTDDPAVVRAFAECFVYDTLGDSLLLILKHLGDGRVEDETKKWLDDVRASKLFRKMFATPFMQVRGFSLN